MLLLRFAQTPNVKRGSRLCQTSAKVGSVLIWFFAFGILIHPIMLFANIQTPRLNVVPPAKSRVVNDSRVNDVVVFDIPIKIDTEGTGRKELSECLGRKIGRFYGGSGTVNGKIRNPRTQDKLRHFLSSLPLRVIGSRTGEIISDGVAIQLYRNVTTSMQIYCRSSSRINDGSFPVYHLPLDKVSSEIVFGDMDVWPQLAVRSGMNINATLMHFRELSLQNQQGNGANSNRYESEKSYPNRSFCRNSRRTVYGCLVLLLGCALIHLTFHIADEPNPPVVTRLCYWSFGVCGFHCFYHVFSPFNIKTFR